MDSPQHSLEDSCRFCRQYSQAILQAYSDDSMKRANPPKKNWTSRVKTIPLNKVIQRTEVIICIIPSLTSPTSSQLKKSFRELDKMFSVCFCFCFSHSLNYPDKYIICPFTQGRAEDQATCSYLYHLLGENHLQPSTQAV